MTQTTIETNIEQEDIPVFFWLGADAELIGMTKEEFNAQVRKEQRDVSARLGSISGRVEDGE